MQADSRGVCSAAREELGCWGSRSKGHADLSSHVYNRSLTRSTLKDTGMELFKSSHTENASQHCCPSSAVLPLCPPPASILLRQLRLLQRKESAHSSVILFLHLVRYKQKAKATFCSLGLRASLVQGCHNRCCGKLTTEMSDGEFTQEQQRGRDKLNILLMFSVIFSHKRRRNTGELNRPG